MAGAAFYDHTRLKKIRVEQRGTLVREYQLDYHAIDDAEVAGVTVPHLYDRLKTVKECAPNSSNASAITCLPPTYFKWDGNYLSNYRFGKAPNLTPSDSVQARDVGSAQNYDPLAEFKPDLPGYPGFYGQNEVLNEFGESAGFTTHDDDHLFFGDVNGDGLTDLVGLSRRNNSYYEIQVATASTNTATNVKDHQGNVALKGRYFRTDQFVQGDTLYAPESEEGHYPVTLADVDGDGRSDLVAFRENDVVVMFSNGDSFSPATAGNSSIGFTYLDDWRGENLRLLVDVNGDGRSDIVGVGNGEVRVSLSTGSTARNEIFGNNQVWSNYFGISDGFDYTSGHNEQFELADVNGDGLPDIVAFDNSGVKVALNDNGERFGSHGTWDSSITDEYFLEKTPRSVGDVNGDGLADLVVFAWDGVYISYSTGTRFTSKSRKISSFTTLHIELTGQLPDLSGELIEAGEKTPVLPDGKTYGRWSTQKKTPRYVMDVNGDGLSDLLGFGHDGVHVALSNGEGFEPIQKWLHPEDYSFSSYVGWDAQSNNQPRYIRSFGDVNGDGLPDIIAQGRYGIYVGDNFMEKLRINHIVAGGYVPEDESNNYLGLHRSIEIEYEALTGNQGVYQKTGDNSEGYRQFPLYVVAEHHDSNGEVGLGRERQATLQYYYEDLKVDRLRGMQGFKVREVYDPNTNIKTQETYYQDFPHTGQVKERETRHTGNNRIVSEESIVLKTRNDAGSESGTRYYQTYTDSDSKEENEFDSGRHIRTTERSYSPPNDCGLIENITQVVRTHELNNNALESAYTQKTTNSYPQSGGCFEKSRLKRTTVEHSLADNLHSISPLKALLPSDYGKKLTRTSAFEYNAATGLLEAEIVEPDDPKLALRTAYTHDAAGNVLSKTVSGHGGKRSAAQDNVSFSRTVNTTYDDEYRFAETVTNAVGQTESFEYDPRFGTVTKKTDAYGLVTETLYNAFGQKYLVSPPIGGDVLTRYHWDFCNLTVTHAVRPDLEGSQSAVSYTSKARYCTTTTNQEVARSQYTKTYYDQVDRVIRVETIGVGDGGSKITYADKVYDNETGRLMAETRPYYRGAAADWIEYQYDDLGRTVKVKQPDGGISKVAYQGLTTQKTNALGQTTTEVRTPRGKMAWVLDAQNDALGRGGNQVGFIYDAVGNLLKTAVTARDSTHEDEQVHASEKTVVTTFEYNDRNHKTSMSDPSMGTWDYAYNALGELTWQRDAKQQEVSLIYDNLGRLTSRAEEDLTTLWYYFNTGEHQHRLREVRAYRPNNNYYGRSYTYNAFGQVIGEHERITFNLSSNAAATTLSTFREYDAYGRLDRITYPKFPGQAAVRVRYQYDNNYGHLYRLSDADSGQEHWSLQRAKADGQMSLQRLGNAVNSERTYDSMGRLQTIDSFDHSSDGNHDVLQALEYDFDQAGNLTSRQDTRSSSTLSEAFQYDELNRLIKTDTTYLWLARTGVTATTSRSNRYDGHGNLRYQDGIQNIYGKRTRFGSYSPYQVGEQQRNGDYHGTTEYDANGNLVLNHAKSLRLRWTSFNKVDNADRQFGFVTRFAYGDKHQRIYKEARHGTTWYLGDGLFELYRLTGAVDREEGTRPADEANSWQRRFHLMAGGRRVGTLTRHLNSRGQLTSTQRRYYLTDHLGSTDVVVDQDGERLQQLSYTAWGERREDSWHPDGLMDYGGLITNVNLINLLEDLEKHAVSQGFTGHEHDDQLGLINMKGRLYDPQMGRFMSADPHIQAPHNTQSYNRYTYVLNNPLSYTDPSGYLFKSLERSVRRFVKKYGRTIIAIAAAAYTAGASLGWTAATSLGAAVKAGVLAGGVSGAISTGSIEGALRGAFFGGLSAGLAYGIGSADFIPKGIGKGIAHGVAQGGVSRLQGAKFNSGFVGGFLGHVTGASIMNSGDGSWSSVMARTALAAAVGGTTSALTGGKFANAAITAAFSHLFNNEAHVTDFYEYMYSGAVEPYFSPFEENLIMGPVGKFFGTLLGAVKVPKVFSIVKDGVTGRFKPIEDASGAHSVYRRHGESKEITHYIEYASPSHPKDPRKWVEQRRYDGGESPSHYNKVTKQDVGTPHIHDSNTPGGVRSASPNEIPRRP